MSVEDNSGAAGDGVTSGPGNTDDNGDKLDNSTPTNIVPISQAKTAQALKKDSGGADPQDPKNDDFPAQKRGPGRPPKAPGEKKEKVYKLPEGKAQKNIADVLDGTEKLETFLHLYPAPETKLRVFEDEEGNRQIYELMAENRARNVSLSYATDVILRWVYKYLEGNTDYNWTHKTGEGCAKLWRSLTTPTIRPFPFLLSKTLSGGEKVGYVIPYYECLPFELIIFPVKDSTPLFDEMFSRMTNALAVMIWIGSLLDPASDRQQYVWLYGDGNDGKGALMRFLHKCFRSAAQFQQGLPDPKSNKHWALPFVNKRLMMFPDFDDYANIKKGFFKSLTGDDAIYVDPKGKVGFSVKLNCKLLFASQLMPSLTSRHADLRRILFAEMKTTRAVDPDYEKKLWAEGADFLSKCYNLYLDNEGRSIKSDEESLETIKDWASTQEIDYEEFFEENFILDPAGFVAPDEFNARLRGGLDEKKHASFRAWLWNRHKVRRKTSRKIQPRGYAYEGIISKNKQLPPQNCIEPMKCMGSLRCKGSVNCANNVAAKK